MFKLNRKLNQLCIFLLLLSVKTSNAQNTNLNTFKIKNVSELKEFFRYTPDRIPLVCGHRGGAEPGYPENCIATFEHTLSQVHAFFELDPRLTKDSVVVVLHDATLDRTTNGTGNLIDYTWEELQKFRLKDPKGKVTDYRIQTLDEIIEWAKGKTVLMLDKKNVPLPMLLSIINRHHAESWVLVSSYKPEEAVFYHQHNKNIMFEAFIKTEEQLKAYEATGIPWSNIVAYLSQPKKKALYDALHERGVMCIIYTAPVYEKNKNEQLRIKSYQDIINSGTDIILANKVVEAANALKPLIPVKSSKKKFFRK
ncbi:glycerophosphodiester phosphodiesterase family protein [Pedobacter sp. BS3]|uniref:glycerophosphodiester phosphodiesterase family protein n=1 Tax=Pedobacter sp. BS3 TaxID=2567937 RepID=UPI0016590DC9|nr:glycerophosphodiester phosphodiesterase family protein [Pedobacter sp. BS3]